MVSEERTDVESCIRQGKDGIQDTAAVGPPVDIISQQVESVMVTQMNLGEK
jgi:hypothetical protein